MNDEKTLEILTEAMIRIVVENGGEFLYKTVCGKIQDIHYTYPKKKE